MAEKKISMLIVVVDLDCHKCYHKIRKILCQLQDHERIRTISFDTKSKMVTIVGPFEPQRLACKLRCKGGKVVRDVHIVDASTINAGSGGGKPPPETMPVDGRPPPVKNGKKKNKGKQQPPPPPPVEQRPPSPPPPESAPPPGPPPEQMQPPPASPVHHHPPPPPDRGMSAMVPQPHYVEEKPPSADLEPPMSPPPQHMKPPTMDMPAPQPQYHPPPPEPMKERPPPIMMPTGCPGQPVPEYVIPTVEIPSWPAPPVGPCGCPCCAPCYQGYYDSCLCGCCGRVFGTTVRPLPPACGGYRGCRTFSDDDPSAACSVM